MKIVPALIEFIQNNYLTMKNSELVKKTGLSRPTVEKYVKDLRAEAKKEAEKQKEVEEQNQMPIPKSVREANKPNVYFLTEELSQRLDKLTKKSPLPKEKEQEEHLNPDRCKEKRKENAKKSRRKRTY